MRILVSLPDPKSRPQQAILMVLFLAACLIPFRARGDALGACPTQTWSQFYSTNGLPMQRERLIQELQTQIGNDFNQTYFDRCIALCAANNCFHYSYLHQHPDGSHTPTVGSADDIERANPRVNAPNGTLSIYAFEWVDYSCKCYNTCPTHENSSCAAVRQRPRPEADPVVEGETPSPAAACR